MKGAELRVSVNTRGTFHLVARIYMPDRSSTKENSTIDPARSFYSKMVQSAVVGICHLITQKYKNLFSTAKKIGSYTKIHSNFDGQNSGF